MGSPFALFLRNRRQSGSRSFANPSWEAGASRDTSQPRAAPSSIMSALAEDEKKFLVEVAIDLPAGFQLDAAFLGLVKPATIGGVAVDIVLPDFEPDSDGYPFGPKLDARASADWVGHFDTRDPEGERKWPFGSVTQTRRAESGKEEDTIEAFLTARLLALPTAEITLSDARRLKRAADEWTRLLETWLEVVSRQDLHEKFIVEHQTGRTAFVWIDRGNNPRGSLLGDEQSGFTLNFGKALPITPSDWGRILTKASEGVDPPEAHLFIRDARQALNESNHRRAVLDAATAAEISLAELRDKAVQGADSGLAVYIEKKVAQIDRLAGFLRAVGETLPENITEDIARPRNDAIHRGHDPSKEIAAKALLKAEEITELATPWSSLL
jgi:hypothetical protein